MQDNTNRYSTVSAVELENTCAQFPPEPFCHQATVTPAFAVGEILPAHQDWLEPTRHVVEFLPYLLGVEPGQLRGIATLVLGAID